LVGISPIELALRYDVRGRLITIEDQRGLCQELSWDAGDQLIGRRLPGGAFENFAYDDLRRLRRHEFFSPVAGRVVDRRFEYDGRDNVAIRDDAGTGRFEFRYDEIGRLMEVNRNGQSVESYEYDAVGTVLGTHRGARTVSTGGRVLNDGARRYEYGPDGSISTMEVEEGRYQLSHNVDGQLVAARFPDGREARYAYDSLGRRVWKEVGGTRVEFIWHSCDLAAEVRGEAPTTTFFYYYQEPLAQWSGRQRQIPIVDRSGVTRALVDERGDPLWRADYEAYGLLTREIGTVPCSFRFRGQYHDRETGLYYNFHRYYEPRLAGYTSPDPLGLAAGSNFYLYPRNPLLWDDPFGLTCSNKHKGQMGEEEMDAHYAALGYTKLGSHDDPAGGGPGRPQGIDGVYHNPDGTPPYIIAEAKYGSAGLGDTVHSGQQMSDHWIDTGIGGGGTSRLEAAAGPANAAAIQNSATTNPGSVQKQVFTLPAPGTSGTGSVTQQSNYNPGSGSTTL
jgi:RHS repeat-associated protein